MPKQMDHVIRPEGVNDPADETGVAAPTNFCHQQIGEVPRQTEREEDDGVIGRDQPEQQLQRQADQPVEEVERMEVQRCPIGCIKERRPIGILPRR